MPGRPFYPIRISVLLGCVLLLFASGLAGGAHAQSWQSVLQGLGCIVTCRQPDVPGAPYPPATTPATPPVQAPPPTVVPTVEPSAPPGSANLNYTPPNPDRLKNVPIGTAPMQPPPQATSPPSTIVTTPTPSSTFSSSPNSTIQPPVAHGSPGEISLAKAAAERMPLDISLDGAYYSAGNIVFSGRDSKESIDAGLLLTAMRAACENEDLYFSLDPENGPAWLKEG